jgi:hypothetical protein
VATNLRKEFLVSALVILVSIGAFSVGFWWLTGDLGMQAKNIASDRLLIDRQIKGAELLAELKGIADQAAQYQRKMDLLLPTEDQLFDFRPWLLGLASSHNVILALDYQEKVTPGTGDNKIGSVGFSMALNGGIENIVSFMKDLEAQNQRFMVAIDTLELIGGAGARVSAEGKIFFRKTAPPQ